MEAEAACAGGGRLVARLRMCAATRARVLTVVAGAYAITGGLGGLGLRAAVLLLDGNAVGVVVSSRSGRAADGGLKAHAAAMADVVCSDVADAGEARCLLIKRPFHGVLHAAGGLRDRMLRSMSIDDVTAVFAPKADAASFIHRAMARAPLDAMGLFSSVAAAFGNVGQANYAAANSYLDTLSCSRRMHGLLGSSLQIPAVSGAGMGAATFGKEQLYAMGAISLDEFAACLSIALAPGHAVTERTLAPLAQALLASTAMPVVSELSWDRSKSTITITDTSPVAGTAFVDSLTLLGPLQQRTHVEASVLRVVRELTGAPTAVAHGGDAADGGGRRLARCDRAVVPAALRSRVWRSRRRSSSSSRRHARLERTSCSRPAPALHPPLRPSLPMLQHSQLSPAWRAGGGSAA